MRRILLVLTMAATLGVGTAGVAAAQVPADEAATTTHQCGTGAGVITVSPSEKSAHGGEVIVVRTVHGPCDARGL